MAFDRREQNREIFEAAMRLCKKNNQLRQAIEASKAKQYVVADEEEITAEESRRFDAPAKVVVSKKRSLEAAGNKAYEGFKVCVHNFASATNPGGGVVSGASAQEECICRCSTLYPNLNMYAVRSTFHEKHKMLLSQGQMDAAYNDDCVFTPEIVVFKTDDNACKTMEEAQWYRVDVITCAAPNLRKRPSNAMNPNSGTKRLEISHERLQELHEKRLRRILTIAKKEQEDVVILGAFGCGAFQNPPEVVAKAYKNVIPEFLYDFRVIEFAVYCAPHAMKNYDEFYEAFGKTQKNAEGFR